MSQNLLSRETSPYLLQHKLNPVHWRAWGPEALAEARRLNRPILLSVGYAACHWCHVMAHESFEDDSTASVMNAHFVNIKVDREERPDIDLIYQSALALMGEQGGWPLTMFLTPAGEPFWGGTYFPKQSRYGRPAFVDVLRRVAEVHTEEAEAIRQNVAALRDGLARLARPAAGGGLGRADLDAAAQVALIDVDTHHGGTHGAPKFPQPGFFRFLWRAHRRTGEATFREAVTTTLDALCQGGIYDHLGGGFARYSTDAFWLVPHFEKMLYDNAQLLDLLAEVWRATGSPLYAARAHETVDWLLRDMPVTADDDGTFAFASAYDADSEGVEGKYYVWSETEIDAVLGDDAGLFKAAYGVTAVGNWEGVTILNRSHAGATVADNLGLAEARAKLLEARRQRVPPAWDDKVLADWNGLAIAALASAGSLFGHPAWIHAARVAFAFVARHMADPDAPGRLFHSWRAGQARHAAVLDDYANLARAALALHQATEEGAYLARAEAWTETLDRHYWDDREGGYFLTADDAGDLITRPKTIADHAVPPGNGTMVEVLGRLFLLTGKSAYRDRAEALVRLFSAATPEHNARMPTLCVGAEILEAPVQIVVLGPANDPARAELLKAAREAAPATAAIAAHHPDEPLPEGHPAAGKGLRDGRPTAYVCAGATCGLPKTDAGTLRQELAAL
ncbi:MAG: thioredoxin domain-containing protein [Rhodospirillales bacterium]|nr:thioredoxin domain-containing protein [Rhodospirillales bacterium]